MERCFIDLPVQRVLFSFQVLAFVGALVLVSRPRWLVRFLLVTAVSLTGFIVVKVYEYQAPPSNYCHYYLGAKYKTPYQDFYRIVLAGRGEPLLNFRNLQSYRLENNDPEKAGRYFGELLDQFGVRHPPGTPWRKLMQLCDQHGLFPRYGQWFLTQEGYAAARQQQLAADLRVANINVRDCGFNGSPFYVLVRQFDPVLHRPLSLGAFRLSVLVELALLALACTLLARAFGLGTTGILLSYVIILASWDYYDWILAGLPGMLWYLPVAAALFYLARERYALAGVMVAVAGLLKIFPGLLVLPAVVSLGVGLARKEPVLRNRKEVVFLGATVVAGLVLALVAQTQADWLGWFGKIRAQFLSGAFVAPNDIAFFKTWQQGDLGLAFVGTAVTWLARALLVAFLVVLLRRKRDGRTLALAGVASLAMMPWISREYLQYYSFPIALTVVFFHRDRRSFYVVAMLLLLVNQALVDFPHATYVENIRVLVWPKTLYYYVAPLLFLYLLMRGDPRSQGTKARAGT